MFHRKSALGTRHSRGFTLVELLVVIGIIALLIGILIPTVRKMRISSQEADTRNLLNQIDQACQQYFLTNNGYPGPLPDTQIVNPVSPYTQAIYYSGVLSGSGLTTAALNTAPRQITGAENLVLGLLGGIELNRTTTAPPGGTGPLTYYDPESVGKGPSNLNRLRPGRTDAYIQTSSRSSGRLFNAFDQVIGDTIIPEFIDRFSGAGEVQDADDAGTHVGNYRTGGMPILYFRSHRSGISSLTIPAGMTTGQTLVSADPAVANVDFHLLENGPYLTSSIGTGRESESTLTSLYKVQMFNVNTPHGLTSADPQYTIDKANQNTGYKTYRYPYDAYDYFVDPASYDHTKVTLTAADIAGKRTRKKDSYVLISAGRDRIYGTEDDITNFGNVQP